MRQSRYVMLVTLAGFALAGLACTQKTGDEALDATRDGAATAIDEIQAAGGSVARATSDAAERTADKASEFASTTSEAITDAWITTQVSAKFVDEALLKGSDINVDTDDHVVTLKGTVASAAAKDRAAVIARGTDGVTRVVNQLVVS